VSILRQIAAGLGYEQIVRQSPELSYLDIFAAASEALRLNEDREPASEVTSRIKSEHPRAYEKWSRDEDEDLVLMFEKGMAQGDIAARLRRQPSAIRARLEKLGRLPHPTPPPGAD